MRPVLTPRQLAEAIGVSESSVKRWVDDGRVAASRTVGGHRRIALQEAIRFIRTGSIPVVRPEVLGLRDVATYRAEGEIGDDPTEQLFEYLRMGGAVEARGLVVSSFLAGASVADIVDGPLAGAMARLGELWQTSPAGIFWEHRATQIAVQALNGLRLLLAPRRNAATAVGGAPSGDRYLLPSLAAAAVLEEVGIRAINLGPETPVATLALAAAEAEARFVWMSVSVATEVERLRRELEELAARLARRGAILVVGGAQSSRLALSRSEALYVGRSMAELGALVQGARLVRASEPAPA